MTNHTIASFGSEDNPWLVPEIDRARQATASLRGYVYQLHQSAAAWLALRDGELLVLEAAEDYAAILKEPGRTDELLAATQVKNREDGAVNLNSADVIDAIEALYRLQNENPGRPVRLVFQTTSEIGRERKTPLPSGTAGLIAWTNAAAGGDVGEVRAALIARLVGGGLKTFVVGASDTQLRERILAPMVFACGAPGWKQISEANRDAVVKMRSEFKSTSAMAFRAYDAVVGKVIEAALSQKRTLDRPDLIALLARASSVSVSSQIVEELLAEKQRAPTQPISLNDLHLLAKTSVICGEPPSLSSIFPGDDGQGLAAYRHAQGLVRNLVAHKPSKEEANTAFVPDLVNDRRKHLIWATPGAGKTHALWQTAKQLLGTDETIPVYLRAGQINTWQELTATLSEMSPDISLEALFRDERVCFFIDGWSEFAAGDNALEKRKAFLALRDSRVIATAKTIEDVEPGFKVWSLQLFSRAEVEEVLRQRRSGSPVLPDKVKDLLRLPLLLSMHLLAETDAAEPGELLRQFHDRLAKGMPPGFTYALADAAFSVRDSRAAGSFRHRLAVSAQALGIDDPLALLAKLGTLSEVGSRVMPIHDLYWSWLSGVGALHGHHIREAVPPLATRGEIELALEAGITPAIADIQTAQQADLVLASTLAAHGVDKLGEDLVARLDCALADSRLPFRSRGALAALASRDARFIRRALGIKRELSGAGIYLPDWAGAFRPDQLYAHRAELAEWVGGPGTDALLQAIAENGGPEWVPWLEQVASREKLPPEEALATALACDSRIPVWGMPHLDKLFATIPWKLRPAVARGANLELGRYVAMNYGRLTQVIAQGSSGWIDLNRIILSCHTDELFEILLINYEELDARAQEYIDFAVAERGDPWVARFQRIAFKNPGQHHHRLEEVVSMEIDDETARGWFDTGHAEIGWRVLIARHGEAVLPELLAQLPANYAGVPDIPALGYLRHFSPLPESILPVIWGRMGSPMMPKPVSDLLRATAQSGEPGIAWIVNHVISMGSALPAYFRRQALMLYKDFNKATGLKVIVQIPNGPAAAFDGILAFSAATSPWENHFSAELLAAMPQAAIAFVMAVRADDITKAAEVLQKIKSLKEYDAPLLDRMLGDARLSVHIPEVFADAFENFPDEAIQRCLSCANIDQGKLLFRLGSTSNPMHRGTHAALIKMVLSTAPNFHHFRYVAGMMRGHNRHDIEKLLTETETGESEGWFWLVREVEMSRAERLLDDSGNWLA